MTFKAPYHPLHSLRRWHTAIEQTSFIEADSAEQDQIRYLRAKLILEEALEVIEELGFDALVDDTFGSPQLFPHDRPTSYAGLAKELADLKVVTYGTDDVFDIPAYEVFNEVMSSNQSKIIDGRVERRQDGKILKGKNYQPADVESVLAGR